MTREKARTARSRPGGTRATPAARGQPVPDATPEWTFLTNHAHVLLCLAADPAATAEAVARRVGITERSTRRIIGDLEGAGYVAKQRVGRNNHYAIDLRRPLRHPVEEHRDVGELIRMIVGG